MQVDRSDILERMQRVMGPLPGDERRCELDVQALDPPRSERVCAGRITYQAEPGDRVPAWLIMPVKVDRPLPAMVCLHQTTAIGKDEPAGVGGKINLKYAFELACRGYITLTPDYPRFGDYKLDPATLGYASTTMKGIWNHMRAVDVLCAMDEVDSDRVGVIGHSLGGHNSLFVAAFDTRIRVAVTSAGFSTFATYYQPDLAAWGSKHYMPRIITDYGANASRMPFDFTDVLAAIAPRALFINAPLRDAFAIDGVRPCVDHVRPIYEQAGVADRLETAYPDCGHDFPPAVREQAYAFVDRVLR